MSLFGLFGEKDCDYFKKKAQKLIEKEDFYNALITLEKGKKKVCQSDEGIDSLIKECKERLSQKNLELAKAYFEAGDYDEAIGFAETCVKYAIDEDVKKQAEDIIREIETGEIGEAAESGENFVYEDVGDEEYYEILSEHYPDFIKEEMDKDERLKEMCIAINRGELEKAQGIESVEPSFASDYLKVLYYSLKEEYEKAFEVFESLFKEKREEFTEAMLTEYLELVRRLEKDEGYIEKVLEVGSNYLDVVKLAAAIYLERGDVEKSENLVNYGFEIMDKLNPDRDLIATAGMLYFQKKDYEKCIDFLGNLKDMYARMGHFVFPPDMAVPLAYSYYKVGKYNEGLELLLHNLKEEKHPDIVSLAKKIAEKSDREDLKRQLKYLVE